MSHRDEHLARYLQAEIDSGECTYAQAWEILSGFIIGDRNIDITEMFRAAVREVGGEHLLPYLLRIEATQPSEQHRSLGISVAHAYGWDVANLGADDRALMHRAIEIVLRHLVGADHVDITSMHIGEIGEHDPFEAELSNFARELADWMPDPPPSKEEPS